MYNDFKKKRFGGNDRGGYKGGRGGDRGGDWKPMFPATCAECGDRCEVPFKPNGSKPVLCRNCFKGGSNDRPMRSERHEHSDRGSNDISGQLSAINEKLDAIIEALSDDGE
jgi:CxxC-x17-CxxC domain-containing protein